MKTKDFLGMLLMAFLAVAGLTACSEDNEGGRKITDYKEYTLMVASVKLPGVVTSCGNNVFTDVYAVKKEQSTEWESQGSIGNFEYEEGYEYQIRISETSYLDYSMGEPAWTEDELLEVISKEHRNSENLPPHFIPNWYFEQRCPYIIRNLLMPSRPTKKRTLRMTLKPMLPTNLEACAIIYLLLWQTTGFYWMTTCTLLNRAF